MSKVLLANVSDITSSTSAQNTINVNTSRTQIAMENTLSRDGTSPNQMLSELDMNSFAIINLPEAVALTNPVTLEQMTAALSAAGNINTGLTGVPVSSAMQPVVNASTIADAKTLMGIPASAIGFRADKNNVNQTGIPSNLYTKITFPNDGNLAATGFDHGGYFNTATGAWTPPAGLVFVHWQLFLTSGVDQFLNNLPVVKVIDESGSGAITSIDQPSQSFSGVAVARGSGILNTNGSQAFHLELFCSSAGNSITVDSNPAHTFFGGFWIGP